MVGAEGGGELKVLPLGRVSPDFLANNKPKPERKIDNDPAQQKSDRVHSAVTFTGRIRVLTTRILRLRAGQISVSLLLLDGCQSEGSGANVSPLALSADNKSNSLEYA